MAITLEITLRDLLSHRSGLRRRHDFVYYRNAAMTREELLQRFRHFDLYARPRQSYQYSNAAYVAVGHAMERAAGVTVLTWGLKRALPVKFKAADLNGRGSEVGVEELHLAHEGFHLMTI